MRRIELDRDWLREQYRDKSIMQIAEGLGVSFGVVRHRLIDYGIPRRPRGNQRSAPETRFWEKVDQGGSNDCWEWTAGLLGDGYGNFYSGKRTVGAHRFSYELHFGPIKGGLICCHKCDNPRCVNPAHLFLGTVQDNIDDCIAKKRHQHGETHRWARLSAKEVEEIRGRYGLDGWTSATLAQKFGCSCDHIRDIVTYRKRKDG